MPTLEQRRAAHAWQSVKNCTDAYMKLAKGAPALIMNNGLMQALAFYHHKGKDHHLALNRHILGWLKYQGLVAGADFQEAMNELQRCSSPDYRRATLEALELLKWIRQFAAAVVGED